MVMNENILIAVHNRIIALDIKRQLSESGYSAKIVNPYDQEKIDENLNYPFQLIIFERSLHSGEIKEIPEIVQKINRPAIYLTTEADIEKYKHPGLRVMQMPFDKDELQKNVKIALGVNRRNNQFYNF